MKRSFLDDISSIFQADIAITYIFFTKKISILLYDYYYDSTVKIVGEQNIIYSHCDFCIGKQNNNIAND